LAGVGADTGHDDDEIGRARVADPDLSPVQHPMRAVENRARLHRGGSPPAPGSEIAIADDIRPSI